MTSASKGSWVRSNWNWLLLFSLCVAGLWAAGLDGRGRARATESLREARVASMDYFGGESRRERNLREISEGIAGLPIGSTWRDRRAESTPRAFIAQYLGERGQLDAVERYLPREFEQLMGVPAGRLTALAGIVPWWSLIAGGAVTLFLRRWRAVRRPAVVA